MTPSDLPTGQPEEKRIELGDDCEYGCDGRCENLSHWKDRASYFLAVSESALETRDKAASEATSLQERLAEAEKRADAAEAERDAAKFAWQKCKDRAETAEAKLTSLVKWCAEHALYEYGYTAQQAFALCSDRARSQLRDEGE